MDTFCIYLFETLNNVCSFCENDNKLYFNDINILSPSSVENKFAIEVSNNNNFSCQDGETFEFFFI